MSDGFKRFIEQLKIEHTCPNCQGYLDDGDEFCKKCGARNPQWNTLHKDKCPKCLFMLTEPSDKYCRLCGAYVVEGTYNPMISEWAYGTFGPVDFPTVEKKHICYRCGFTYYTSQLHDEYRFCPQCGGRAPAL